MVGHFLCRVKVDKIGKIWKIMETTKRQKCHRTLNQSGRQMVSSEAAPLKKPEKTRPSKLATAFGHVTRDGGSLVVRMTKGLQLAKKLGLPEHEDVLVAGVRGVGAVITTAPRVVTGDTMIQVLDQIKQEIDILRQNLETDQDKMKFLLHDWMGRIAYRQTGGRLKIMNPRRETKKKKIMKRSRH